MPRIRLPAFPELEKQILMRGIKKKEIADLLGITAHALSNKLTGQTVFTLPEVRRIGALFPDVSWEVLFHCEKE